MLETDASDVTAGVVWTSKKSGRHNARVDENFVFRLGALLGDGRERRFGKSGNSVASVGVFATILASVSRSPGAVPSDVRIATAFERPFDVCAVLAARRRDIARCVGGSTFDDARRAWQSR